MGIYHVPLAAEYFSAFSTCLSCCVWGGLSVCWKDSSLLWSWLPVGGVGPVTFQGFLVMGACVGVLVGGGGSLLFGVQ